MSSSSLLDRDVAEKVYENILLVDSRQARERVPARPISLICEVMCMDGPFPAEGFVEHNELFPEKATDKDTLEKGFISHS